jgi:hypothetical protein
MSDVIETWLANGPSGFGTLTQALLETQNATQVASAGVVVSQAFLRALIDAATANGSL